MHIKNVHLIHDDLVIATKTEKEHESTLRLVMEAISDAGVTLNPSKCVIGAKEIEFWGMLISSNGIHPNPTKGAALNHITPPNNKEELTSFLCMMQANEEFMPNFSQKSAVLRELTQGNKQFQWADEHMACFDNLLQEFRDCTTLRYFDPAKSTFILVDAHVTGLGATLAQGNNINSLHPVAFASRTTSEAEIRYPQLDLEAMSIDFGLRRLRNYILGSPEAITVITDHKPLFYI